MEHVIISCTDLVKSFGIPPLVILKSISFAIYQGEFVGITGKSGSGKSTLLYVMSGLDNPSSGKVMISGESIHEMDSIRLHQFRNSKMGFVFQFHYLLSELTALENILMPARKSNKEKVKKKIALDLLNRFDLNHCRDKRPSQMSGGEQQRVSIARSLIMEPEILFVDEPTGNLDSVNGEKVMDIFNKINIESKTTIVMVTHEKDFAKRTGRQIHLVDGAIHSDYISLQQSRKCLVK